MANQDPFHEGERAVQALAGESLRAEGLCGMIGAAIAPGALA